MADFTGTNSDEIITPFFVSSTVTAVGGARPSNAADVIDGGAGNDVIDGGGGNDVLLGGDGNDLLIGGAGDDVVTGGKGSDVALLGAGDDVFIWNPGDGSDVVEGGAGTDTLVVNGNGNDEHFDISANGSRAILFRDVGNVTMDLNSVEKIQLAGAGGVDTITVNDLTGTDVKQVAIDLAAAGTSHGDGQSDQVIINASNGSDFITIDSSGGVVKVSGLAETVTIAHAEGALDVLTINGLGGDDVIDASGLSANQIGLVLNGGDGNDVILGSHGDDAVNGGKGNDVAALGGGNDVFTWNPGDGSDTVDGQAGFDTLVFNGGANASENVNIFANGDQATFFRDVAAVTMHLNSIERIEFSAGGGADNITVNDLTGTGVKQVAIDFTPNDNVNGQADTVTVDGTVGNDHIDVTASGAVVTVSGLPAQVTIDRGEAGDFLSINGGAGNDTIDASKMPAGTMALTLNGGDGNDTIIGGAGNDVLAGGSGNDTFVFNFGASGHDVIQDFQVHGASAQQGDVVRLEGGPDHTFAQAVADGHIAQSGADVVISDGTNVIATLQHISVADLHAHDFMFV